MPTLAEMASQMTQQNYYDPAIQGAMNSQQQRRDPSLDAMLINKDDERETPVGFNEWKQGAFNGKELSSMNNARKYYDNWANKYWEGDTGQRNSLLANHGLQFAGNNVQPGWGYFAGDNISRLPQGSQTWMGMQGMGGRGRGRPGYGEANNVQGSGGYNEAIGGMRGLADRMGFGRDEGQALSASDFGGTMGRPDETGGMGYEDDIGGVMY